MQLPGLDTNFTNLANGRGPFLDGITSAEWIRSGLLVTGGHDAAVRFWDVRRGDPLIAALEDHEAPVSAMKFAEGESVLAVACHNH